MPICDNAGTIAGAGTDVRRCSDALGPRKRLHGCVPHGRASHGRVPHGCDRYWRMPHGRAPNGRVPHGVYLMIGMYVIGVHLKGVY
jgi:hypothetical protein